jgi:hypothetical protein
VLWNQEHSAKRGIKACAELEAEFDLNKHDRTPAPKTRPSRAEKEIATRKGTPMSREKIQDSVDKILAEHQDGIDFDEFRSQLAELKIEVLPYAPGGVLKGVSYSFDSLKWPGSKVGRPYSAGLTERGVRYRAGVQVGQAEEFQAPTATHTPVQPARDKYARAPGALRQILRDGNSANHQTVPAVPWADRLPAFDMHSFSGKVGDLTVGPLSKAMLLLGAASVGLGLEIIKAIIRLLQWLLNKLGFGLRPVSQNTTGTEQFALGHEPYYLEVEANPVEKEKTADEQAAAQAVLQLVAGLSDPSMLPDGEGRTELVAALQQKNEVVAAEAAKPTLDDIFAGVDINATQAPEAEQRPDLIPDPIISLKKSGAEYIAAVRSLTAANQKPDCGVIAAGEKHSAAEKEWAAANVAYQPIKGKFRIFAGPEKVRFLEAEKLVAAALKDCEAAQAEQDRAPASVVPPAVSARFQAARVALLKDGRSVVARAQQEAEEIDEPQVKRFALARAASVKAALTQVLQVAAPGELHKAIQLVESTRAGVAAKLAEIEQLKLRQTHTARLAPAQDAEPVDPDAPRA